MTWEEAVMGMASLRSEVQLRRRETGRVCKEVGSEDEVARTLRIAKDAQRRANL